MKLTHNSRMQNKSSNSIDSCNVLKNITMQICVVQGVTAFTIQNCVNQVTPVLFAQLLPNNKWTPCSIQ